MPLLIHPSISPSPVSRSFPFIEWNAPIVVVSKPEHNLLKSAYENPTEYIVAEYSDVFAYVRLLLKILDQVTGPSNPGSCSAVALEAPVMEEEEALQYLKDDKQGVITQYLIHELYTIIGLLADQSTKSPIQIFTMFYQQNRLLEDWRPLLRLLYRPGDPYSQRGAALCLMHILHVGCSKNIPAAEETLQSLVSWLTSRLQSSSHHSTSLGIVTPTLMVLGTSSLGRRMFNAAGGVGYLSRHLRPKKKISKRKSSKINTVNSPSRLVGGASTSTTYMNKFPSSSSLSSSASVQQVYELCFCLWTMSNDCGENEDMKHHFARDGAVVALSELIAAASREKVVRLALSTLRKLADVDAKTFVPEMIACGLLKSVDLLKEQRQWTDPDILEDLNALHCALSNRVNELTKWEVYQAELDSGNLRNGILHTEQFFNANARKMEGKNGDFAPVKRLIHLISRREDDETTSVALFDLGEFVRCYPNGKVIVKRFGAKEVVMPLLKEYETEDIQRQALQCISKMLVSNWRAAISK